VRLSSFSSWFLYVVADFLNPDGRYTKCAQVCSEELGIPLKNIHTSESATNTIANSSPTAASAGSDLNGAAIKIACAELRQRLEPYWERLGPGATIEQVAKAAYLDRVNLTAQGHYKTPQIGYEWGKDGPQKPMYFYFTQGVGVGEVEIDVLTGDWTNLRTDIKLDIGRSINPAIDYGQIEGAFVQGQGLFTTEETLWTSRGGVLATRGPGNYKIPTAGCVPVFIYTYMTSWVVD
jgi:xanthine dehydrogenase/oxidase